MSSRHIKWVGLARNHDRCVFACYLHWDREHPEQYEDTFKEVLRSNGWNDRVTGRKANLFVNYKCCWFVCNKHIQAHDSGVPA